MSHASHASPRKEGLLASVLEEPLVGLVVGGSNPPGPIIEPPILRVMEVIRGEDGVARCPWGTSTPVYREYHDLEWGMPVVEDAQLFEKVCLEGFQSGLSWLTILRKRPDFRRVFRRFDLDGVARFNRRTVGRLLRDPSIVRHRGKIESTLNNAKRALELRDEFGSLAGYFWQFEPRRRACPSPMPSQTPESVALSRDLKSRGWTFVGPTTMYAFMQAMGLVNDHLAGCAARRRCEVARRTRKSLVEQGDGPRNGATP
jgi:DNA-3-methyladenine glycosylase I